MQDINKVVKEPPRFSGKKTHVDGNTCCGNDVSCGKSDLVVREPVKPRKKVSAAMKRRMANQIPETIQNDPELTKAIKQVCFSSISIGTELYDLHFNT